MSNANDVLREILLLRLRVFAGDDCICVSQRSWIWPGCLYDKCVAQSTIASFAVPQVVRTACGSGRLKNRLVRLRSQLVMCKREFNRPLPQAVLTRAPIR